MAKSLISIFHFLLYTHHVHTQNRQCISKNFPFYIYPFFFSIATCRGNRQTLTECEGARALIFRRQPPAVKTRKNVSIEYSRKNENRHRASFIFVNETMNGKLGMEEKRENFSLWKFWDFSCGFKFIHFSFCSWFQFQFRGYLIFYL